MRFNSKKVISLCMAAAILSATTLVGCSNKPDSSASSTGGSSNAGGSTTDDVVKLTIGIQQSPTVEDLETNYYTKLLEERTNVDLSFALLPADANDAKTKIALMVSSNSPLPDIWAYGFDATSAYDYATKGIFVEATDKLTDKALAPHFNAIPDEDRNFMFNNSKLSNGKIYSIPSYGPNVWNEGTQRFWVYKPWLEKLGLKMPTTTEEFYTVAKAFAEQDPNGNGKKDEIAILGSKDGWGQRPFNFIMNAFTYANPDKQYFAVEGGKIVPAYTKDEWKQGLEYMTKLVKENLFSPISFTQDGTQLKALIGVENGMAGFVAAGSYSTFNDPSLKGCYDLMPPIAGPNGNRTTAYNPTTPALQWWITKDCKNPDAAFKVGDYMLEYEMSMSSFRGEKGVDWTDDPAVCEQYMGNFEETMGIKPNFVDINYLWGTQQNKMWGSIGPQYNQAAYTMGLYKKADGKGDDFVPTFQEQFARDYKPCFPKEFITRNVYTPEETEKITNSKTAIDTYIYDTAVAFITGNKPLSEWDNYIKELEKMGLNEYVTITQAAFDRTK